MYFNFNNIDKMNNNEILVLFKNDSIADEIKSTIINDYYERINKLPNDIFIKVLPYITKPNILLEKYQNKLNVLNYDELVELIYDINFEQESLLTIIKLDIFKNYLNIEKENDKNDKLQTFYLSSQLFLSNKDSDLIDISNEISKLLSSRNKYSKELLSFIEIFLSEICDNIKDIDKNVINCCLSILSITMSKNMVLTKQMIKFYTLYRLKELDLFDYCDSVVILNDADINHFGNYQPSKKKIIINYNYINNFYSSIIKKMNITNIETFNSLFNKEFIFFISHELGHVIDNKKRLNIIGIDNLGNVNEDSFNDPFSLYSYRSTMLRYYIGRSNYHKNHDKFIDENRADLFAIIDSSKQMNSIFKNAFSSENLHIFAKSFARKIIDLYTELRDEKLFVISPLEKFDRFASNIEGINFRNNAEKCYGNNIYSDLLLGSPIPIEILVKILDIAKGNIVTNDLNSEIIKIIEEYNINKENNQKK